DYGNTWFGEGEVKVYLNGDDEFPTLAGTGTEDYIGTAWGQSTFEHDYQGALITDNDEGIYTFYRYPIHDPIYFHNDIKVTMQQIGGGPRDTLRALVTEGANLIPVTGGEATEFRKFLEEGAAPDLNDSDF